MTVCHRTVGGGGSRGGAAGCDSTGWEPSVPVVPLPSVQLQTGSLAVVSLWMLTNVCSSITGPDWKRNCSIHAAPIFFLFFCFITSVLWNTHKISLHEKKNNRTCLLTCVASIKSHTTLWEMRRGKTEAKMHTSWNVQYNLHSGLKFSDLPCVWNALRWRRGKVGRVLMCADGSVPNTKATADQSSPPSLLVSRNQLESGTEGERTGMGGFISDCV